jgi:hypothetical protein
MSQTQWKMKGEYMKNCNCIATCPCDTVGLPYPDKGCEGMAGMHITEGYFGSVRLDGLNWAVLYSWPGALHEGNGTIEPIVDVRATEEQRNALLTIMSGKAGNKWFEVLAAVVTTVHQPQFLPIQWQFDQAKRRARMVVPGVLESESIPLTVPADGSEQRVVVRMPDGMEYKEFEVAQTKVLKGIGSIKFSHPGRHSSLAVIDHNQNGIIA